MCFKKVFVKRKKTIKHYLWILRNEVIKKDKDLKKGDICSVYEDDKFIGNGLFNWESKIAIRLYSFKDEDFDVPLIKERILKAYQYRKEVLPDEEDFRLVYGESDLLTGTVIDKYQNHFVVQIYSYGVEIRKEKIFQALIELFDVKSIFEKNDFRLRELEKLPRYDRLAYGELDDLVIIKENGVKFYVDIKNGQKTGYFFDHRITRRKVRELAKDKKVLDVFCYTGSFSINAALGGAKETLGIDGNHQAIELAKKNAELNKVDKICHFLVGNAFNELRNLYKNGVTFDLIILDPPPFLKSRKELSGALRGYKDINLWAMKLLKPGGILVTSTCSHHFYWQDFLDTLNAAAEDAKKNFRIIERTTQGPDHPILLSMPETEYLRTFFLEVF
jgi:23S rRNA (cytosine1962-C5)-methyltransferase